LEIYENTIHPLPEYYILKASTRVKRGVWIQKRKKERKKERKREG
jgi:hypothetical protein